MSVLDDYEKKCGLTPIDAESVLFEVEAAEGKLRDEVSSARNFSDLPTYNRAIVWMHQRNRMLEAREREHLALRARINDLEAERERLGRDVNTVCANHQEEQREHARTSLALREARSELEDLRGRKLGNADTWAEAASEATGMYDHMRKLHEALKATIRSLLDTELPAGELRRAIGELVK